MADFFRWTAQHGEPLSKALLDRWLAESGIFEGPLFRTLRKGWALAPGAQPVSEDLIL